MHKKVLLLILDGWGITQNEAVSAIAQANTPYIDSLLKKYPNASLRTDGLHVGLPEGQMGNSEVGHMNLGAGRIVYQDLVKINQAVASNSIAEVPALQNAFDYASKHNKTVHFIGLVSDGGVHSHIDHLKGLVRASSAAGLNSVVHAFTDGRDVDPHSGVTFMKDLVPFLAEHKSKLASVIGRYYAMDRDRRWERIKKAYDLICNGTGQPSTDIVSTLQTSYQAGVSDEFIPPIVMVDKTGTPVSTLHADDVVIFFNFRTDRGRQLTEALTQESFPDYNLYPLKLYYVTLTNYDDTYKNIHVMYPKEDLSETLGEVLSNHGKTQIRIAETEKYPHVTFFFSGGRETLFDGEKRLMCPSPKVATYDLQPEMSAEDITKTILPEIENESADFIVLNFANTDMVGHTGVFSAAVKAAETVDHCLSKVIPQALANGYTSLIIADHGNSETMINEDGSPNTAHTTNPVPIILVDNQLTSINSGILANVAPTILDLMGIEKPKIMNEKSLLPK
ncbi:2,3-bisphosphoglycerate-independent phosphoglycerate mutase [Flavobacteriaceae bacterium F08102]|nr:2,3-bisphosphoglycerate-independent phosphoglycerate mutase [Flavobacteriaceae bacterium F08102]